jgi:hypothetical protein
LVDRPIKCVSISEGLMSEMMRPYASIGNSTGDRQMLERARAENGSRLKMLVYHATAADLRRLDTA